MAYTVLDLQTAVQDDLKDSSFSTTRILRYLNYGQLAIFNTHMFKFCEKAVTGPLTIGEYTYDQQADHQATIGGVVIDGTSTNVRFYLDEDTYMPHRDFFEQYPDPSLETANLPVAWTEFDDQVYFNCPVDKAYNFTQRYFKFPAALVDATDVPTVPQSFRELLELYAAYRAEKYRGNHDVAATYKQDFEDGLENMVLRYANPTQVAPARMKPYRTRPTQDAFN